MTGVKDARGIWMVDPAELERVYTLLPTSVSQKAPAIPEDTVSTQLAPLRRENDLLMALLEREQARADKAEERFDGILKQLTDLMRRT